MMKKYTKAPLPFLGQKRNWLKFIKKLNFGNKKVIDLFGGSGLLSHTIKQENPLAEVIWNDFEDYQSRLDVIDATEQLRLELLRAAVGIEKASRLTADIKKRLIKLILKSQCSDWVTISTWLLFSGNYAFSFEELIKPAWYYRVPRTTLYRDGYLEGVERVQCDFKVLFDLNFQQNDTIYIADPPYIFTNQTGYMVCRDGNHFRLKDAIEMIRFLHTHQAILFSSSKSETNELLEVWKPKSLVRIDYKAYSGGCNSYTENMFLLNWPK